MVEATVVFRFSPLALQFLNIVILLRPPPTQEYYQANFMDLGCIHATFQNFVYFIRPYRGKVEMCLVLLWSYSNVFAVYFDATFDFSNKDDW